MPVFSSIICLYMMYSIIRYPLMRWLTLLILLAFVGCCSASTPPIVSQAPKLTTHELVEMTSNATAVLYNDGGICSAVWITNDVMVSAYHCVNHSYKKQLMIDEDEDDSVVPDAPIGFTMHYLNRNEQTEPGQEAKPSHNSQLLSYSRAHDLVLLIDKTALPHGVVAIATKRAEVGDRIEIVGAPVDLEYTYVEGIVSGYREDMSNVGVEDISGPFLQVSAPIFFGNSGGGVFDRQGRLLGIASFMTPRNVMIGFYIPTSKIYSLLAKTKFQ